MPDRDNIQKTLSRRWQGAVNAARQGPEVLAKFAASVTVNALPEMLNAGLMQQLLCELERQASLPAEKRGLDFRLPSEAEASRATLIAVKAAQRVLVELVLNPQDQPTVDELRGRLSEQFCLEVPRAECLGILAIRVPSLYADGETALAELEKCEQALAELLEPAAREVADHPEEPAFVPITKPRRKRRRTQEELVGSTLTLNLENP